MARVPLGYRQEGDEWAIEDEQAAVVRRIFAEFMHMYAPAGLTKIAHALNVDRIPTQRGGQWHVSTVKYIRGNACYDGGDTLLLSTGNCTFRRKAGWPP